MAEKNGVLKKYFGLVLAGGIVLLGVLNFSRLSNYLVWVLGVIFPFILGPGIAFILNVPMSAMERRFRIPRILCLLITLVLIGGIIFLVMVLVIPELGRTMGTLANSVPAFFSRLGEWARTFFSDNPQITEALSQIELDTGHIWNVLTEYFRNGVGSFLGSTVSTAMSIVNSVGTFFMAFIFAVYVLMQKEKLGTQINKLLYAYLPEKKADRVREIGSHASRIFSRFISGQCIEVCILSLMFFVTLSIFRFPYALMISILVGITAFIPFFGAFIACFIGAFLILMISPVQALLFVVLFLVLQQIEGNLIYPHVMGNSVGLPSIWVFAAVVLGGNIMGIAGMIIFIPLCSLLYALLRENMYAKLKLKESPWADIPSAAVKEKKSILKKIMNKIRRKKKDSGDENNG